MRKAGKLFLDLCGSNGVGVENFAFDGELYVITTGTGEGTFLYRADDIEAWAKFRRVRVNETAPEVYSADFCHTVLQVTNMGIVREVWRETGLTIHGMCCEPLLPDVSESDYIGQFGSATAAGEFETAVLSAGREFLPACALEVLDGARGTPDYWQWLIEQTETTTA